MLSNNKKKCCRFITIHFPNHTLLLRRRYYCYLLPSRSDRGRSPHEQSQQEPKLDGYSHWGERSEHKQSQLCCVRNLPATLWWVADTLVTERADANFFVKPNEQSETCFDFAMARKNRRRQPVASLLLERGRALGWGWKIVQAECKRMFTFSLLRCRRFSRAFARNASP